MMFAGIFRGRLGGRGRGREGGIDLRGEGEEGEEIFDRCLLFVYH